MRPPLPIPEDVAALASEFAAWRRRRPHQRARVPTELFEKAVAASRVHSVNIVARSVKLDRRKLSAGLDARKRQPVARQRPVAPAVLRLAPITLVPAAPATTVVVEIENPAGWRLRLSGADAQAAVRAFMEART